MSEFPGRPRHDYRLAGWNPHPETQKRLAGDWLKATGIEGGMAVIHNWRVVPVRVHKWRRWAIYRNGVRMWAKRSLPDALAYIRRHA